MAMKPTFLPQLSTVEQAWRRARKHTAIEDLHFHDLRHEATSRLFEKGLNPHAGCGHYWPQDIADVEAVHAFEG
ncbi:MAG: tyrosine-type recombinase/integrase [Acidithiobacillus sp.]